MFANVLKISTFAVVAALAVPVLAADAPAPYAKSVMEAVSAKAEYPKMARMRHQQGAVQLLIAVDAAGKPANVSVEKSSGVQSLDDAATAAVAAAAPFAAPSEAGTLVHGVVRFAE